MILNIRGTGGAGKSTIAKAVMARYARRDPIFTMGRKQPVGYICSAPGRPELYVVGHYETPCGGADTITNVEEVFAAVRDQARNNTDVLWEGIITQDDVVRTAALHLDKLPLRVIWMDIPLDICLSAIQSRRIERGDIRPFKPKNTIDRAGRLRQTVGRLRDSGIDVRRCQTRIEAQARALEALEWEFEPWSSNVDVGPDVPGGGAV